MPRPAVEYPDGRITKHVTQVLLGHARKQPPDVVDTAQGHHLREEDPPVGEGTARRLPPDVLPRHGFGPAVLRQPIVKQRRGCAQFRTDLPRDNAIVQARPVSNADKRKRVQHASGAPPSPELLPPLQPVALAGGIELVDLRLAAVGVVLPAVGGVPSPVPV